MTIANTSKKNKLIISTIVLISWMIIIPQWLLSLLEYTFISAIPISVFSLILLSEIIDNVQVLLGKQIMSIEGEYLIIRQILRNKRILISDISFKYDKLAFTEYLLLKHGSKRTMIKCNLIPDVLEKQLRRQ